MKQFLLATTLILAPVGAFTVLMTMSSHVATAGATLGDMSPFKTIIADVQSIAMSGDFKAAEARITDFETAWDDAATAMRPLDRTAWGNVDQAADAALDALRASVPAAGDVTGTLATLMAELENPALAPDGQAGASVAAATIGGIAVTDANGRALPCEDMLATLATTLTTTSVSDADKASATALQTRALERCNADDDARADGFSAQALAILGQ